MAALALTQPLSQQLDVLQKATIRNLERIAHRLPEPIGGASKYACMVAEQPKLDQKFCELMGKMMFVTANVLNVTNEAITLFAGLDPLNLNKMIPADTERSSSIPTQRSFVFPIPKEHMNEKMHLKFCMITQNGTRMTSNTWTIDLKDYGFHAIVNVGSFALT